MFLRGHGSQASSHHEVVNHQSGPLGLLQGDAQRRVQGTFYQLGGLAPRAAEGALRLGSVAGGAHLDAHSYIHISSTVTFDNAMVTPTADENRPVNVAVRYLMKAKM